ncbi:MAG: ADP-L-glycero-D-manno-heptose-6-epimerase [SAR116 cluster bacterium MED-G04]|jgi:ADP-L-glycero-D-manno-heptose 6-epimerase|nr:ADP-glyceromanno-heptose 6-epimerase [SAR116 cluster bacterium]OUW37724.1 MAG: ADP-glyceromanno-heptose 6-epimerase [Gammaproteobacteria bacterium TMED183]CAI8417830.1 MAG: ADP-L-glycero-D-manno-heptose-6-epimerase [SAR116 cluster bacterium MED-G04]HCD50766.1 ADP-glyceromanno-heptose 6-epimerase [Alphaproteobacteria bacterium]HCV62725.1 ADP-glyceromanno-heptose 6-epimerase [Alphaproteobacteria bacterium]|tara:strand:+ start:62 stop:1021 length:960 start_codon:yes stop_codon:yes gene_type:complete
MYVITGGAGFIGSNVIRGLNGRGINDILIVDCLKDGQKIFNLSDLDVVDFVSIDDFGLMLDQARPLDGVKAVFHQGANSSTTEWDGALMMRQNFTFSKKLLSRCHDDGIPLIYASSASVYGNNTRFAEQRCNENPINAYAYSKFLFDCHMRHYLDQWTASSQVVGLRYFNVFGPYEQHKAGMASVVYHFNQQAQNDGEISVFGASHGYDDGEHERDFIHVDDVVKANLWFLDHPDVSGIFNIGTGMARSFNDIANQVRQWHTARGKPVWINYIDMPASLQPAYQAFTRADISSLRSVGYDEAFTDLETGVNAYLDFLNP